MKIRPNFFSFPNPHITFNISNMLVVISIIRVLHAAFFLRRARLYLYPARLTKGQIEPAR